MNNNDYMTNILNNDNNRLTNYNADLYSTNYAIHG